MKIFTRPETNAPKEGEVIKKGGKGRKHAAPLKPEINDSEIREKLASHVETSNTAKSQLIQKNSKALGSGFMNTDAKIPEVQLPVEKIEGEEVEQAEQGEKMGSLKDSHLLLSDVKLNDPTDPNTQEKLKSVLKNGAFSFNPKEKETLERILAGS